MGDVFGIGDCQHVTILILVEGSLQFKNLEIKQGEVVCHNPYFSRRFFAISHQVVEKNKNAKSQSLF